MDITPPNPGDMYLGHASTSRNLLQGKILAWLRLMRTPASATGCKRR